MLSRLLLLSVSTVVALTTALAADLTIGRYFLPPVDVEVVERGDGYYELKPNADLRFCWGTHCFPLYTDENGFRVGERGRVNRRAPVVLLGDSFSFGVNGAWPETYAGMIEPRLGAVVNTGVSGYSSTVYAYQYRRALDAKILAPTHVVIAQLGISDVHDEATYWMPGPTHPVVMPQPRSASDGDEPGTEVLNNLPLTAHTHDLLVDWWHRNAPPPTTTLSAFTWRSWESLNRLPYPQGYGSMGVQRGLAKVERAMEDIARTAKRNGGRLYLLIQPWPSQLRFPSNVLDWECYGAALCARLECEGFINAFPAFRDYRDAHPDSWYRDLYVPRDIHFSARGNRLVADEILRTVSTR